MMKCECVRALTKRLASILCRLLSLYAVLWLGLSPIDRHSHFTHTTHALLLAVSSHIRAVLSHAQMNNSR